MDEHVFKKVLDDALTPLRGDIKDLKDDVSVLKEDVSTLKEDVNTLKGSVVKIEQTMTAYADSYKIIVMLKRIGRFPKNNFRHN